MQQQYDAARPVGSIPGPSPVHQWPVPQPEHAAYLSQTPASGMMPPGPNHPVPDNHPGMHDPAMIQAAQLLIPGDYQAPGKLGNAILYSSSHPLTTHSTPLPPRRSQPFPRVYPFLGFNWSARRMAPS